jgi:hypothetical protein
MDSQDEVWAIIEGLEYRIRIRQQELQIAKAAADALDEKIVCHMAERLIYETECVLKDAAGE